MNAQTPLRLDMDPAPAAMTHALSGWDMADGTWGLKKIGYGTM